MAFHTASGTDLARVYINVKDTASLIWKESKSIRQSANSNLSAENILSYASLLSNLRDRLGDLVSVNGIAAYARDQSQDQSYDIVAEFGTMRTAVNAVINWIINNTPKDGNGKLTVISFALGSARMEYDVINAAALAGFRTVLDTLIASMD